MFMIEFQTWLNERGEAPQLGGLVDDSTPASGEVKRTGLQPQVDAQDIKTKSKAEQDKIGAIDAELERIQEILGTVDDLNHPKLGQFKAMWNDMLDQWENIKFSDDMGTTDANGLGSDAPNPYQIDMMKRNQPLPRDPVPAGSRNLWQFLKFFDFIVLFVYMQCFYRII